MLPSLVSRAVPALTRSVVPLSAVYARKKSTARQEVKTDPFRWSDEFPNAEYPSNKIFENTRTKEVLSLINKRVPGYSLPKEFYTSLSLFEMDLNYVWRASWLFAGYTIQIKKPGEYFTYEVGSDSVIIIRGDDNVLRAFHNTCRHRGSKVVKSTASTCKTRRLVCPYHQWSYDRSGNLTFAKYMPADFDLSKNGLHKAHVKEVNGLIWVSLTDPLFDFAPGEELISKQIERHGFRDCKIAKSKTYTVNANWKLVYENNRECYHCAVGHPEYVKSNYDLSFTYFRDENGKIVRDVDPSVSEAKKSEILSHIAERTAHWNSIGVECTPNNDFPGEGWYRASRVPLRKGWITESLDGQPVSTIMGTLPDRDMGSLRIHTLPNFWIHASSDYASSARITPISPHVTEIKVDWIVDEDAVEGEDYDLEKLLPFWEATSEQDWNLCEVNHAGVLSSKYQPGRLSDVKELGLEKFIDWYLKTLYRGCYEKVGRDLAKPDLVES